MGGSGQGQLVPGACFARPLGDEFPKSKEGNEIYCREYSRAKEHAARLK
jgi:hypothetical protein